MTGRFCSVLLKFPELRSQTTDIRVAAIVIANINEYYYL